MVQSRLEQIDYGATNNNEKTFKSPIKMKELEDYILDDNFQRELAINGMSPMGGGGQINI